MPPKLVRIALFGAAGKMGRAIARTLVESKGTLLVAAIENRGNPFIGKDLGEAVGVGSLDLAIGEGLVAAKQAEVWIDFSAPTSTVAAATAAAAAGAAMVIGTTGLSQADKQAIAGAAKRIPIVLAPNTSLGVNLMIQLVAEAARVLGPEFDLEIVETHHRAKRDAPSGTALRLAQALAEATSRDLESAARFSRHGDIGPRAPQEIGIQTVRGGDVVGDHTVFFLGSGERLEITHRASSRETFARGAVRAAMWVAGKPAGLYDMSHVLAGEGKPPVTAKGTR